MCGIIGIVSKKQVVDRLIDGLERLEYRGYDSAGIATVKNSEIDCSKSKGKLVTLKNIQTSVMQGAQQTEMIH